MKDSWLSGLKKLQIPRPKMTVQRQRRPADPPRDYHLTDDVIDDHVIDQDKGHDHQTSSGNSSDSNFS